ncbi:MAG TPA: PilZ domain-containing protein, partial [Methylomicrobium sp.]|nr:PilZ domain-containing protein [Methylomicrobium sp.]
VSQGGAAIEADSNVLSDRVAIVFNDNDHQTVGILGKVAYAKKTSNKTYLIGVSFQAGGKEKLEFVTKIVKFFHYYKRTIIA